MAVVSASRPAGCTGGVSVEMVGGDAVDDRGAVVETGATAETAVVELPDIGSDIPDTRLLELPVPRRK